MRLHLYRHYLTRGIIESQKDSIDAMPEGQALPEPNREFNRRGRRGTRRRLKTLAFLCAYSAVIFLDRKHRIAIRRPISIPEQLRKYRRGIRT